MDNGFQRKGSKKTGWFRALAMGEVMGRTTLMVKETVGSTALIALAVLAFMAFPLRGQAAFPCDMNKKPVVCRARYDDPELIKYYGDPEFRNLKGIADHSPFEIKALKVKGEAIYGTFKAGGKKQTGWFKQKVFVKDPSYKSRYYTVRSAMTVYTTSSRSKKQDTIKKYSGVITISKKGGSRQVIYQKKKGYATGWMSADTLTNTLEYDGREKQILADGAYLFRCGFHDNKDGGKAVTRQPDLKNYQPCRWELKHIEGRDYCIKDSKTQRYLTLFTRDGGLSFGLCQTKKPDLVNGRFRLERINGSFTIESVKSGQYLAQDEEPKLILARYKCGPGVCWRVSALKKMVDTRSPLVITQYDPQWCGTPYGGGGCMGTAGCGILAPVNAVYALSGQYMDVMELADYAVEKNYRIVGSGTDEGIFKAACKKFGKKYNFAWDGHSGSMKELKKKLKAGDTAVVHVLGHYVSIVAYSKKRDKFLMLDSNYLPKREDTPFGDWISPSRLIYGTLESQGYFFFKLRDPV